MDTLNEFDFDIQYIPGETNHLADALSRIYSDEPPAVVRASSEYVSDDEPQRPDAQDRLRRAAELAQPVYTGAALLASIEPAPPRRSSRTSRPAGYFARLNNGDAPPPWRQPRMAVPDTTRAEQAPEAGDTTPGPPGRGSSDTASDRSSSSTAAEEATLPLPHLTIDEGSGLALTDSIKGRYGLDPVFRPILRRPDDFKDFTIDDDLIYRMANNTRLLCIPDALGHRKTLAYLRAEVWWPSMAKDVQAFCESCRVCATSKSSTTQPMGLLRPLPVPRRPWESIGIDFVGPLPESSNRHGGFDMIVR